MFSLFCVQTADILMGILGLASGMLFYSYVIDFCSLTDCIIIFRLFVSNIVVLCE